jgi:hypothetical protein
LMTVTPQTAAPIPSRPCHGVWDGRGDGQRRRLTRAEAPA